MGRAGDQGVPPPGAAGSLKPRTHSPIIAERAKDSQRTSEGFWFRETPRRGCGVP
jgi:hypothetical protein